MEFIVDQFRCKFGIPRREKIWLKFRLTPITPDHRYMKECEAHKMYSFLRFSAHLNCSVVVRNFIKRHHTKKIVFTYFGLPRTNVIGKVHFRRGWPEHITCKANTSNEHNISVRKWATPWQNWAYIQEISGVQRGGVRGFKPTPPKFRRPSKIVPNSTRFVKTVTNWI